MTITTDRVVPGRSDDCKLCSPSSRSKPDRASRERRWVRVGSRSTTTLFDAIADINTGPAAPAPAPAPIPVPAPAPASDRG
ncbi:hypothetical protein HYFRA_00008887 [Hymenoscyphus fraxineus]|uniref:Uncharacterized protein n=1 Tax=Hymenoscyphus fraxineus TaxID=746836 RepID=A0A9N9PQQ1_9HELO|nr:hypothetical protein HYFRA_00008887 [Hymenoscyphus fraxineus]